MLLIVIFSFNRAMQLDYLLKSILERLKVPDYKITIIYHTTGEHSEGYLKIRNKYKGFRNVFFLERKPKIFGLRGYFRTFYKLGNFKKFLKNTIIFNKKCDNFKYLLEHLLHTTECEYVMFNTDDGFFFDDVEVSPKILNLVKSRPLQTSYRLYVGENLDEFPDYLNKINNDYYIWNYYENSKATHWTYPFAVDGTVYHTKSILNILRKVFYHNPITLESRVVGYVAQNNLLETGLGPITSKLICTKLNRVSTSSSNPTININTDFFNKKFLEDYELELDLPTKINNANIVPLNVFIVKAGMKQIVYSLNDEGRRIQNSLDTGGAKSI